MRAMKSPRLALLRTLSIVGLTLVCGLAGCEKGDKGTTDPGTAGDKGDSKGAGIEFAYAPSFKLNGDIAVMIEFSTAQGSGNAEIAAKTLIEGSDEGGKLKVHGKVLELSGYKGSGSLDPEFMKKQAEAQGQPAMDIVAELGKSESWSVLDRTGEADEAATEALPENATPDGAPMDFGLFNLPNLPTVPLEVGKPVKLEREDERELEGMGTVPVEIEENWTLVKIDETGGKKIAEIKATSEASGATEVGGGQGTLSLFDSSEYTILFDMTTQLPVSLTGNNTTEISIDAGGQSFSLASGSEITATYTPAT